MKHTSPFLLHSGNKGPTTPTLKFHNHFPPDTLRYVAPLYALRVVNFNFTTIKQLNIFYLIYYLFHSTIAFTVTNISPDRLQDVFNIPT